MNSVFFVVIKNNGMECKMHFYLHLRVYTYWLSCFYPLLTSGGCTTFKHASTNSVKIGSSMFSCMSWSGCGELSSNCNIFLTCGFSRHCFNSVDCSVTIKIVLIISHTISNNWGSHITKVVV